MLIFMLGKTLEVGGIPKKSALWWALTSRTPFGGRFEVLPYK
jgi:hypothetical protein